MINKWIMKETNLMKRSLEKWGHAPIILGGASTHLFECSSTHYFKRARAPIIQEGTSTHHSNTTKQSTSEWTQMNMKEIKFMKCSLEKMRARTHYFKGSSTHYLEGHKHSSFKEQSNRERANKCKMNMKEISSWNALLKKWGSAPIIFEGSSTHYFGGSSTHLLEGHEHSPFREHSIREQMNEHMWM